MHPLEPALPSASCRPSCRQFSSPFFLLSWWAPISRFAPEGLLGVGLAVHAHTTCRLRLRSNDVKHKSAIEVKIFRARASIAASTRRASRSTHPPSLAMHASASFGGQAPHLRSRKKRAQHAA